MSYWVTVRSKEGEYEVAIPEEQVEFFKGDTSGDPYQAALYLAYCDRWATRDAA